MDIQCKICKLVFKSKHKFYVHLTTHDRKKKLCALQNGYKIFYIWEHEVKQNFQDAINKCKSFLQEE